MSKILVIFGATGQQGGSIIDTVLNDEDLSKTYKMRAVTRDPSRPSSQSLQQKGIEVVVGDVDNPESLKTVFQNAHTVFLITGASAEGVTKEQEIVQGKAATDAAVAAGVQYLIYSTLPNVTSLSGGKFTGVLHFDSKAEIEQYIRSQPIKSAFFAPGSFMSNYESVMAPRDAGDGTFSITNCVSPTTELPLVDTANDTGKYVGAILAQPELYEGKVFSAATRPYSLGEIARIMSQTSGKTVVYKQLPAEVFGGFMPEGRGKELIQMMEYFQEFGYYGPKTAELVAWAAENARGTVTTFEQYLARKPLKL